jgi:hypothetical protein
MLPTDPAAEEIRMVSLATGLQISWIPNQAVMPVSPAAPKNQDGGMVALGNKRTRFSCMTACVCQPIMPMTVSPTLYKLDLDSITSPIASPMMTLAYLDKGRIRRAIQHSSADIGVK